MRLKELLFTTKYHCLSCKREIKEDTVLCEKCRKDFKLIDNAKACKLCGAEIFGEGDYCLDCKGKVVHFKRNYAAFPYVGAVRKTIRRFKFLSGKYLHGFLSECLERKYADIEENIDLITFIPMTKKARRKRGYNQSELLAKGLSEKVGIDLVELLEKTRETKQQVGLNFRERQENLRGCFKCNAKIKGKTVLVIDDVCTTGATLSEAAKALKRAGAKEVITLTVAVNVRQNV